MKSLELLLPYVMVEVIGCPEPYAIQMLRLACIEFCKRTDLVQRIQAPVDIVAGTEDYAVTVPSDMVMARVLGVSWQGEWLPPAPASDVASDVALRGADIGRARVRRGDPQVFFQKTPGATVSLYPIPDTAVPGGLLIKASFAPTLYTATVEDVLIDEWAEAISAGAVAKIKAVAGQPFSANPAHAVSVFERGVSNARREGLVGKQRNFSRVQPRRFA